MSQKIYAFDGLWSTKYVANIQNQMVIFQSKANLDEKIFLAK